MFTGRSTGKNGRQVVFEGNDVGLLEPSLDNDATAGVSDRQRLRRQHNKKSHRLQRLPRLIEGPVD